MKEYEFIKIDLCVSKHLKKIDSIVWENVGLPNDIFVLLAKKNNAFIRENEKIISHGGISLEELIVPFIHVIKNDR